MNRFGIFSRCLLLLAFALPACAVQTGAEDDEQTLESDVSSTAPGDDDSNAGGSSTKGPFALDANLRQFESFAPNKGETQGPNPVPWSGSPSRGSGQRSGSGSSK